MANDDDGASKLIKRLDAAAAELAKDGAIVISKKSRDAWITEGAPVSGNRFPRDPDPRPTLGTSILES